METMNTTELLGQIRAQFRLDWNGIHGFPHWTRVLENGLALCGPTGARVDVVTLFALLHDSQRRNDGYDLEHGPLAADYAATLRGTCFDIDDEGFELLSSACRAHSDGLTEADVTVQTCWDADRLDLGRVGIRPHPRYLCTPAAREAARIEWAWRRSVGLVDPDIP